MITDLLKFIIKENAVSEAAAVFDKQMKDNLKDEGCLMSQTFKSKTNPCEFYLLLCWENQDAIDKHLVTEHDLKFRENLDPLLAGPPEFFDWELIA